jgi:uncharacterized membrane protein HdeD (DUF308 family)
MTGEKRARRMTPRGYIRKKIMKKIKEIIKKIKIQQLVTAIAIAIIGLLFIIFPQSSAHILCYAGGAVLIVWGVIRTVLYFVTGMRGVNYSLAGGIALIAIGAILCAKPDLISEIVTIALGVILIIDGVIKLQQSMDIVKLKESGWWISLIVAGVSIVLGLVTLIDPFGSRTALMIFIGISLIVDAVCDIISAYRLGEAEKRAEIKNVIDIE